MALQDNSQIRYTAAGIIRDVFAGNSPVYQPVNRIKCSLKSMLILFFMITSSTLFAQETNEELAKIAQNPLGNILSFPFQNNTSFNYGPYQRVQDILNIQPIIPFFNGRLITRTIIPLQWQPQNAPSGTVFGLSDIQFAAVYSPNTKGFMIGVGPIASFPTGSAMLGSQKWSAGPCIVLLAMPGHWVFGVLANNLWSFAGNSDRTDVNQMLIQYFVNYNIVKGLYITMAPIITANWEAQAGQQWLVPFGLGVGKVFRIGGKLPLNMQVAGFYNAIRPDYAPDWTLRIQAQVMLPTYIFKKKK